MGVLCMGLYFLHIVSTSQCDYNSAHDCFSTKFFAIRYSNINNWSTNVDIETF